MMKIFQSLKDNFLSNKQNNLYSFSFLNHLLSKVNFKNRDFDKKIHAH